MTLRTKVAVSLSLWVCGVGIALVAGATVAAAQTTPGAAGTPMGTVVVVHGVVDFPADVYLDGSATPALSGFEFRRMTDPLALPAGVHRADLRRAGQPPTAMPTLSGSFTVVADQRVTVAALLDPDGKPSWLAFPNDAQVSDASRAELRFRHFAATGAVSLTVDGRPALNTVVNLTTTGQAAPVLLDPGSHRVSVTDATTGAVLVAESDLDVAAGSLVNMYLTGVPASGLALMQEAAAAPDLKVLQSIPSQIPGGDSGLAATRIDDAVPAGTILWSVALVVAALLAAAVVALAPRRPRPVPLPVPSAPRRRRGR